MEIFVHGNMRKFKKDYPRLAKENGDLGFTSIIAERFGSKEWETSKENFLPFVCAEFKKQEANLLEKDEVVVTGLLKTYEEPFNLEYPFLDGKDGRPTLKKVMKVALSRYGHESFKESALEFLQYLRSGLVKMQESLSA